MDQNAPQPPSPAGSGNSPEHFLRAFQSSPAMMMLTDISNGRVLDVNQSLCDRSGYKREELLGMTTLELNIWPDADQRQKNITRLVAQGSIQDFTNSFRCRDGEIRIGKGSIELMEFHGRRCALAAFVDITDLRRTQEKLTEANRILRSLIEASPLGIIELDSHGNVQTWNRSAEAIFGWKEQEVVGRLLPTVPPEAIGHFRQMLDEELGGKCQTAVQLKRLRKDGSRVDVCMWTAGIRDAAGQIVGSIGLFDDISERNRAQEALRQSEERFQRIFMASPVMMVLSTTEEGRIIDANPCFCRTMGRPREDVIGRSTVELGCWSSHPERQAVIERLRREGSVQALQRPFRKPDGQVLHGVHSIQLVELNGQECVLSVSIDITRQTQAEEDLRLTQFAIDHAADAAMWIRPDGSFAYVSDTACRRLQYSRPELLNLAVTDINPNLTLEHWRRIWERLKQRGAMSIDTTHRAKDGREIPVDVSANYVQFGSGEYSCVFARDISERKAAEAALHREHEFAVGLVDTAQAMVVVLDGQLRIRRFNRFAQQLTGYGEDELLGLDFLHKFVPAENRRPLMTMFQALWDDGRAISGENVLLTRDGRSLLVNWSGSLLRSPSGKPEALLGVGQDVTQLRQKEEQLRQAAKLEAIGRLAGGIAHDFNNMLAIIKGYADLLSGSIPADDPRHADVEKVQDAAQRAAALTGQLLTFGRKQVSRPRLLLINDCLADVQTIIRPLLGNDVDLETRPCPDLWPVKIDPVQLQQVIVNLVVNAREAMPRGGRLIVATDNVLRNREPGTGNREPAKSPLPNDRYARLSVTDTGLGMDEQTKAHLFEPFFTTKPDGKGGLGLATCHGIVQQAGGCIEVESQPGQGATFHVYLPAAER